MQPVIASLLSIWRFLFTYTRGNVKRIPGASIIFMMKGGHPGPQATGKYRWKWRYGVTHAHPLHKYHQGTFAPLRPLKLNGKWVSASTGRPL